MDKKLHILMLEDAHADAELMERALQKDGIIFVSKRVETEEAYLEELKASTPDLIPSDYNLPTYDGMSALEAAQTFCPETPFIFISGAIGEETAIDALKKGATDYVLKDRLLRLAPAVRRALDEVKQNHEKKRAVESLRDSEEKYRLLIENANEAIFVLQDDFIKYHNKKTEVLIGYTEDEFKKMPFPNFIHPEDKDMVMEKHHRRLRGEIIESTYAYRLIHKAGEEIWGETNAVLITWDDRPAVLCFIRDITHERKLEAQLFQSQKMEAVGRLAGGVAHDFNNLMTTVIGNAYLMLQGLKQDDPLREDVEEIKKAGERATALTRQLLAFSRKQMLQMQVVDLNEVLGDMDKMLRRLLGEDVALQTISAPALGSVKVDPGQMEQVIMNLAINARDAMPVGGKLTIETANVALDKDYANKHCAIEPGQYVMVAVSDAGFGMDEKVQSQIFEPFFTTKEKGKGTGLGLATVYGIVKQSGGYIWVYSEPGRGTSFKIYFPMVAEEAESLEKSVVARDNLKGSETILVVEDNEMVRKLVSRALRESGRHVLEARNGKEALHIHGQHKSPIHLLLTDVVMPEMGGRVLAERLAVDHPSLKVLFMSGYTENAIVHHGELDRDIAFIQKPFTPEALTRKVREVLDC